jgi:predicted nucleotidyltransferase
LIDFIKIEQRNITINRKDILETLDFNEDDIVFLSGSLIEGSINKLSRGMGNKLSDIDVFIISKNIDDVKKASVTYDLGEFKTAFKRLYGISIDIEIFSEKAILGIIQELNKCKFENHEFTFKILNLPKGFELFKFTSFIHRFLNGVPVYNEKGFNEIKAALNQDNYFKLMTRIAVNNIDMYYEDVAGNIQSNQLEVAVNVARQILIETMKAYIFSNKTSIDRDKWIPLKLKNLGENDKDVYKVYMKFKKLYFNEALDTEDKLRRNAEGILDFSNEIISKIGQNGGI